jgi:hypothetical protein
MDFNRKYIDDLIFVPHIFSASERTQCEMRDGMFEDVIDIYNPGIF